MTTRNKMPLSKKLAYTYALLTGTSLLFSTAQAGKFDDVDILPLNNASHCLTCVPCHPNEGIGDCGENFVFNLLENKGFETYKAPYNNSGHGIDIVAFKYLKGSNGRSIPLILLHESKMSEGSNISARAFYHKLGDSNSGYQQSRSWLNNAIAKMKKSKYDEIMQLAFKIETTLNNGGYFVRTGNLRVDTNQGSRIQFYALTDKHSEAYALESKTFFSTGPFLGRWSNQYGKSFSPQSNELDLNNKNTISLLNSVFK
ncbi:hypothetical protein [Candidatus Paracaedibacter symbiosus]|uniref:hypothetical protein n=1 Tax=Candidatus Paracaedibacter symbiosus TaxID=244582 RepID=UPI000509EE79|nr:hypothetical protein [Candidatus Paracaedibacter symbiosus]